MHLRLGKPNLWQPLVLQILCLIVVFQWAGRTSLIQPLDNYNDELLSGFYGIEYNASFTYRWTTGTAQLELPQPALRNQLTLWLMAPRAGTTTANSPVLVDVFINGKNITRLTLDPAVTTPQPFTLQWQTLSPFPTTQLNLQVLNPFHAPNDTRELGLIMSAFEVQATGGPGLNSIIWPSLFASLFMLVILGLFNWLFWPRIAKLFAITTTVFYWIWLKILLWVSLPALIVFEPSSALLSELVILVGLGLWQTIRRWHLEKTRILTLPEIVPEANNGAAIEEGTGARYKEDKESKDKAEKLGDLYLKRDNLVALGLFVVALLVYSFTTPNELSGSNAGSHFALVRSITEHASFEIGPYLDYTARTDYASPAVDLYYTDRPPGLAWLAAPLVEFGRISSAASLLAPILPGLEIFKQPLSVVWYDLDWAMLVPILGGAFSVAFLFKLARLAVFGTSFKGALIASGYFGFCTLVWKYSTTFYSHVPAMAMILASVYLSLRVISNNYPLIPYRVQWWCKSLIAFMVGFSVTIDYTNLLLILALLLYVSNYFHGFINLKFRYIALALKRVFRTWGIFVWLGLLVLSSLIGLAIYQAICFGSPFSTSYTYSAKWEWARSLTTTFDRPPWEGLWALYFGWGHLAQISDQGEMRGLLLLSPGLFLSLVGGYYLGRYKPKSLILLLSLILPLTLLMSMHHTYWGGGDFDARYLVVTLPYLCLPIAHWWDNFAVRTKLAVLKIVVLVSIISYSLIANLMHMLLDYPQRISQWNGLIKVPLILPPGVTLQALREPAYTVFEMQQALLVPVIMGLAGLFLVFTRQKKLIEPSEKLCSSTISLKD